MIEQKGLINQLPGEIQTTFDELQIIQCLRKSGFKKKFGFPCSKLFQLVFGLVFYHKNWFQLLQSNKSQSLPGKDAVYRFLNHYGYAWRHFLSLLSSATVMKVHALAKKDAFYQAAGPLVGQKGILRSIQTYNGAKYSGESRICKTSY